jgi:antitoxin MazE
MESTIRKWGNSAAVRLPAAALELAGYRIDDRVKLTVEPGRIVLEPGAAVRYELADLVESITAENLHDEVDAGAPRGRESL